MAMVPIRKGITPGGMNMTEDRMMDLMSDLDVSLLENDYLERDLEHKRRIWLLKYIREKNWRKDKEEIEERVDMREKVDSGIGTMKRKAVAIYGFLTGAAAMAVVAFGFFAIMEKKRRAI